MPHRKSHTAAQVRILRSLTPTARRRRLPRIAQPDAIRVDYFRAIRAYLERARDMIARELVPALPRIVAAAALARRDSARADAGSDEINRIMDDLSKRYFDELRPREVEAMVRSAAGKTTAFSRVQFQRQTRAAFGVDVLAAEPRLAARVEAFVADNVALIKSLPNTYFDRIEATVTRGVRSSLRHEEIAAQLVKELDVAEDRARLIARDQVGKFYAEVNQERQRALGVTRYYWRSVKDERVRPEHVELAARSERGETFSFDDPPTEDGENPGEAILCRCWAEPDLAEIMQEAER